MEYRENRDARRPFLSTPDSRVYFPATAIEEARLSTARCLRRNEGVALVVGATGTGKTLLTRVLAAEFEVESLVAVVSPTRRIDAKSFWQQFLFGLRQTFCGCDETELRLMALDYLERSQRRRCVLLIDDAQNLPFRVFDELRSFVDQGAAASSQICVALFGTSVLEERLNLPPLYPFQQRIVSRSYLDAFESSEIADYIDCEARRVAGKFVFTTDAKRKVADFCKGAPRVANQLCDRALFLATQKSGKQIEFKENSGFNGDLEIGEPLSTESAAIQTIDASLVERAWANLLNLPEETPRLKAGELSDVVEFGTLEDDEEENIGFGDFSDLSGSAQGESGGNCKNDADGDLKIEGGFGINEENRGNSGSRSVDEDASEENERAETEDNVGKASGVIGVNDEDKTLDEEFDEEASEDSGEVDAALEARLLQNLRIWEESKENRENNAVDAKEPYGDRWERADALKERQDVVKWKEATEIGEVDADDSVKQIGESGEFGENDDVEKDEFKTEERVFEALKSEYLNDGFLFELCADVAPKAKERKETTERERKTKTRAKSTSKTRRPIVGDDDGSRLWNVANGRNVDGTIRDDERRFWETQLTAERVANRVVSNGEAEAEAAVDNWETEFMSLEDRAYEQIVEDCWETTGDFAASDEYLSELSLLEQEIEEEANLIRRIRNIHLKLRSVRAAGRKRRRDVEEKKDATPTQSDGAASTDDVKTEDEALNY